MGAVDDPERAPRRGCQCALFITEEGGTQPGTCVIGCLEHRRIAKENFVGD
jgi:hypothetical protein